MGDDHNVGSRLLDLSGPHYSFLGLSPSAESLEGARAVIVPVPYDGTTTYRAGTREGPRAILAASRELELFDEETFTEPHRWGIATVGELEVTVASPREMVARVRRVGESVLEAGKLPVLLGGEHLLSLGMIEAVAARFPDVTILHLDAHGDLRESYQGSPYSNACVMRLAADHGKLVQVGIRAVSKGEVEFLQERNIPCFFAHQLNRNPGLWRDIPDLLGPRVYVSIDLDVFDPSIMPAVGTPEPGGVGWYEVLALLREVARKSHVVGFDVMELLPIPQMVAPDLLAARLVYKFLGYIFMDFMGSPC